MSALWHPFADMAAIEGNELMLVRGAGVYVWDEHGRRYLDGASSLWYSNVGHGRPEIAAAIAGQLAELETFHVFGELTNRPAQALAERLADLAPQPGSKVFLTSGGGDSIETATKLARLYHYVNGEPRRRQLISRTHGYHGTHGIGTSILGLPYKDGFGPLLEHTSQVAWDSVDALAREIDQLGARNIAAFVYEPLIGSGGVLLPPAGYLAGVQELCRRNGILTIADIVITGFGRLGTWLAVERFDLQPDLIVFAKGVTSGYLPLGGVIVAPSIAAPFWSSNGSTFAHGATYSGHATCCAAALANLDLLAQDDLVHRARLLEHEFHHRLAALEGNPLVAQVRGGIGLMAAVALEPTLLCAHAHASRHLWHAARDAGLLTRLIPDGIALAPPLIIERDQLDAAVAAIETALARLQHELE